MKIFICCSKHLFSKVPPIKQELEKSGHVVTLPNSYEDPFKEEEMKNFGEQEHSKWKIDMFKLQEEKVRENDAISFST